MSSIPKIVHRIWFGPNDIPDKYNKWWQAWQRQLVDYEFITWTDEDIDKLPLVRDKIHEARNYAEKSDVARYEIIRLHGGIYLDCDFLPLNFLDLDALDTDFIRLENDIISTSDHNGPVEIVSCSNGFFAAAPNHPVLAEATRQIRNVVFDPEYKSVDTVVKTGPVFWGKIVGNEGTKIPMSSFIPYSYEEPFSAIFEKDLSSTFGIHVWGNSWVTHGYQKYKLDKMARFGDISAMDEIIEKTGITQKEYDDKIKFFRKLKETRYIITKLCTENPMANETINANISPNPFRAFKFFYYIFEYRSQIVKEQYNFIQIGCESDEMNRYIRPTLINFDPHIIVIENDLSLVGKLWRNLRKNSNLSVRTISAGNETILRNTNDQNACAIIADSLPSHEVTIISTKDENLLLLKNLIEFGKISKIIFGLMAPGIDEHTISEMLPGHKVFTYGNVYAAYAKSIFHDYCLFLFAEYGIPNIFSKTIDYIFPPGRIAAS